MTVLLQFSARKAFFVLDKDRKPNKRHTQKATTTTTKTIQMFVIKVCLRGSRRTEKQS